MSNPEGDGPTESPARDHKAVGYGNPPRHRRFKNCGNPAGRPKGARNRKTIVNEVATERLSVLENGQRRRRSTLDLVLLRLRNMALKDKGLRAFEEFHRLINTYEPEEVDEDLGYLVVPAEMTPEEWVEKVQEENKDKPRPQ